ncbi:RNA-binding protein 40-like, partial [Trifolium medium]|nr:RNA-binding protein 40-like [Trifolium medium]
IKIAPKATLDEHKDTGTGQDLQEPEKDTLDPNKFFTPDELEKGKLPPEEILSLPMFKVWILSQSYRRQKVGRCKLETFNFFQDTFI